MADGAPMDKRAMVIREIIATETTYVSRLRTLVEVFIEPMQSGQVAVDPSDVQAIFSNAQTIYNLNSTLLADLERSEGVAVGQLFAQLGPFFRMYSQYLNNYEAALDRRADLLTRNRDFARFVNAAEQDPRCAGANLQSLLIEPVQRVPRYRLLLEELRKRTPEDHPDSEPLDRALESVGQAASHNNEQIRRREMREQILNIMMSFEPKTRINLLDAPSREFVRDGRMEKQNRGGPKEYVFWLFSDKLLYGEQVATNTYRLHREIDLRQCRVSSAENVQNTDRAILVESPQKSFITWARHPQDKLEWMDSILGAMQKLRDQYQSETGRIAPIWTPDAAVTACELCSTKFTLVFRRHHCRNCGSVVCANCSTHRVLMEHIDARNKVRMCDRCFHNPDELEAGGGNADYKIGTQFDSPVAAADEPSLTEGRASTVPKPSGPPPVPQFHPSLPKPDRPPPPPSAGPPPLPGAAGAQPSSAADAAAPATSGAPVPPPKPDSLSRASLKPLPPPPPRPASAMEAHHPPPAPASAALGHASYHVGTSHHSTVPQPSRPPPVPPSPRANPSVPPPAHMPPPATGRPASPAPPVVEEEDDEGYPPSEAETPPPSADFGSQDGLFPYSALANVTPDGLPPGVDPARREEFLLDAEFLSLFGMSKGSFSALPPWKRSNRKKQLNLF